MLPATLKSIAKPRLRKTAAILPRSVQNLISVGRVTGRTGKVFNGLGAASTTSNLILIQSLLNEFKPEATLEVGMAFAASTLVFAHYHAARGAPAGAHIAIDPFQVSYWDSVGLDALATAGVDRPVRLLDDLSSQALPALAAENHRVQFAYVDGAHLFEDVFVDFYFINRLLQPGGFLLFDDSSCADVHKVLAFIRRNFSAHYTQTDLRSHYLPGWQEALKYRGMNSAGKNQLTCFRKTGTGQRTGDERFARF